MTTPTPSQNNRHSEHSEEPRSANDGKRCSADDPEPAEAPGLRAERVDDIFNDGFERLLAGDLSGLDTIDPNLRDTVLKMTVLARTAGWLDETVTPSGATSVRDDEDRPWQDTPATLPALNGHVPSRTANRATGPREVTMQATTISPISHRTRGHSKPVITRAPRFPLSDLANAAMVALVILAGFGAWRVIDGGSGNGPAPSGGHYALAPMTPLAESTALTGNAATACDFSDEVPVYNGVDESPVDGTVIYVTTSHDLMIRCDEEPEDVLLAEDVDYAGATHWPGVVNLGSGPNPAESTPEFLNVLTGEREEYGFENSAMHRQGTMNLTGRSPFVVTALSDDASKWALTDLRSMETRSLGDLGGVEWPRNSDVYLAENGLQGTYALAVFNPSLTLEEGPALLHPEGFPGEIMLVSGSLDDVTWIDVPDALTSPYSVHISPDGEHLALLDLPRIHTPGSATIAILRASDGAEVARTDSFEYTDYPNPIWVNDGEAVVYPQTGAVMILEAEEDSDPQPLLESSDHLFALSATHDPEVVTISESGSAGTVWEGESDRVYAINTRTDSVETFEGQSWRAESTAVNAWQVQPAIVLIAPDEGENGSTRVIDPSTGAELLTVPYAPTEDDASPGTYRDAFPADTLAVSADRGTIAFTMRDQRMLIVAHVSEGDAVAREVAFPEFAPPEQDWSAQVHLSPGGSTVQLTAYTDQMNMQWVLDLTDPDATWQKIPSGVWVDVMPAVP